MNLPNKITVFRFCCIPFLMTFAYIEFPYHWVATLIVYFIACMSDKVDGIIATQEDIQGFLDVLSIVLRDMLVSKQNEKMMLSKHVSEDIINLSGRYSERAIAEIILKINAVRKKLALNVSAIATIDDLLFSILEVRHKWQ